MSHRNLLLLLSAMLSLLAAVGHYFFGEIQIMPELQRSGIDQITIDGLWMGWNLASSTSLISAMALGVLFVLNQPQHTIPIVIFVIAVNIGRYIMALYTCIFINHEMLSDMPMQSMFMAIYILTLYMAIRSERKKKLRLSNSEHLPRTQRFVK